MLAGTLMRKALLIKEGAMLLHFTHTEPWRLLSRRDKVLYIRVELRDFYERSKKLR
jgi:hypothetical protein